MRRASRSGSFSGGRAVFPPVAAGENRIESAVGVHFTEAAHENTGVPIYDADGSALHLHPTQLYESFAMLAVFACLFICIAKKSFNGQVLIGYMILYPIIRFTIEFFRDDPRGNLFGLTTH